MNKMRSEEEFLSQTYQDSWDNYSYSVKNLKSAHWDWVVITASNDRQAEAYTLQLQRRKEKGLLPQNIQFFILADLGGKRIGSGGATLNVIQHIATSVGKDALKNQKILIMHSGGDSKRIPQYSAYGKLFSPVPRCLPNGEPSTLFDELLMAMSGIPSRISSGMLVVPGDTELLFNPLQLELLSLDAAGLSMKTPISLGKDHGVFLRSTDNKVKRFLHKQSEATLQEYGAVDEKNNVDIDTGCIWFSSKLVEALYSLLFDGEEYSKEKFELLVNDRVSLSFYADFVFPLAKDVTLEEYLDEKPEQLYSEELLKCRKLIWDKLHGVFTISLICMSPARYIHFGTTSELFHLRVVEIEKYQFLNWKQNLLSNITNKNVSVSNCYIDETAIIPEDCYMEDCVIGSNVTVGSGVILSGVAVHDIVIPPDIVLHCLKLKNQKYVCRIYGIQDNPKGSLDNTFLGTSLRSLLESLQLRNEDIWTESPPSIWNANIYAEMEKMEDALDMALILWKILKKEARTDEVEQWKQNKKYSLKSSFEESDVKSILAWQENIRTTIQLQNTLHLLKQKKDFEDFEATLGVNELELLAEQVKKEEDSFLKMRIYLLLSDFCNKQKTEIKSFWRNDYEDKAYEEIKKIILLSVKEKHPFTDKIQFIKSEVTVDLPVRVNFCGSPSDAAPYCLEYGGTMLDGALLLNGKLPIHVEVKRISEPIIYLKSLDLNAECIIRDRKELENCGDPFDTFALHKAAIIATGLISENGSNTTLENICKNIGGGLHLTTMVDVPKGSGLGTSSILAAACIKGIYQIFGHNLDKEQIYAQVFSAEQLMNTGGGWQDQVGGFTYGLKYMQSLPGNYQSITVHDIDMSEEILNELKSRFALIFSGQRRLARNVLREEMNQCIRSNKKAMDALSEIRKICALMKFELEKGDVTEFAKYITKQFELVKVLDKGASNTCIEYIFDMCEDLIDGKSVCGAGGGGFLQVILKKGVSKKELEQRINDLFKDCGVQVWDCTLV